VPVNDMASITNQPCLTHAMTRLFKSSQMTSCYVRLRNENPRQHPTPACSRTVVPQQFIKAEGGVPCGRGVARSEDGFKFF